MAETHALIRTSPKGELFVGRCIRCGQENLSASAIHDPCDNTEEMTADEAVLSVLEDKSDAN